MNTLYVDADGCRQDTRLLCERLSDRGVRVIMVANRNIACKNEKTKMIVCDNTDQAADLYILSHAGRGDLVITRDLILVQKLLEKDLAEKDGDEVVGSETGSSGIGAEDDKSAHIEVMSDSGEEYRIETIHTRIIRSEHAKVLRGIAIQENKAHTRSAKEKQKQQKLSREKLANSLEKWRVKVRVHGDGYEKYTSTENI